jgi:hypothetical protein
MLALVMSSRSLPTGAKLMLDPEGFEGSWMAE